MVFVGLVIFFNYLSNKSGDKRVIRTVRCKISIAIIPITCSGAIRQTYGIGKYHPHIQNQYGVIYQKIQYG